MLNTQVYKNLGSYYTDVTTTLAGDTTDSATSLKAIVISVVDGAGLNVLPAVNDVIEKTGTNKLGIIAIAAPYKPDMVTFSPI